MNKEQIITLVQNGQINLARDACLKLLKAQPNDAELTFMMGNIHNRSGKYAEASDCFSRVLKVRPDLPSAHYNLGCALRNLGRLEDAIKSIKKTVEIKPDFFEAWDTLGVVYNQLNMAYEAVQCHKQSLKIRPDYTMAEENLAKAYTSLVPQWHFPMMNDLVRNEAYNEALKCVITSESVVLDIGTGSGLLSMMAARAGARQIYACEMNSLIASKAEEIIRANNLDDKIKVLNKRSTDIEAGSDFGEKPNILVSEILDVGLLAEGVLSTVQHAKNNLLTKDAVVIPEEAVVYATVIECQALYNEYHVGNVCGFDLSLFNEFSVREYMQKKIKDFDYRELTDKFELFTIKLDGSEVMPEKKMLKIAATDKGTAHVLAFWFNVKLCEDVYLDTGPYEDSCWMQAVALQEKPIIIEPGDQLTVDVSHDCNRILVEDVYISK